MIGGISFLFLMFYFVNSDEETGFQLAVIASISSSSKKQQQKKLQKHILKGSKIKITKVRMYLSWLAGVLVMAERN